MPGSVATVISIFLERRYPTSNDSDIVLMMETCNCAADEHQDALFEDLGDDIEDNGLPRFPTVLATLGATRSCPSVQVSHSHHY